VQVLKFVHHTFVLRRADLAMHQRGQASVLTSLVDALEQWVIDSDAADRLPRRLHDLVDLAVREYENLAAGHPEALDRSPSVTALARGRAVTDFVASLTDSQAVALLDALSGRAGQPWSEAYVL
jgi:dGTPase